MAAILLLAGCEAQPRATTTRSGEFLRAQESHQAESPTAETRASRPATKQSSRKPRRSPNRLSAQPLAAESFSSGPTSSPSDSTESESTPSESPALSAEEAEKVTVYVTKTGKKYHQAGCDSLRKSGSPLPLVHARQTHEPCANCQPPR